MAIEFKLIRQARFCRAGRFPLERQGKHFLSHAAIYLVARGVPGLVAFAAIPVFTHLLKTDEFGRYALILATVDLLNGLIFQWLRLSLVRYLPAHRENPIALKSTLVTTNLLIVAFLGLVACVLYLLALRIPQCDWRPAIFPCWFLVAVQAMFELSAEYARASLRPMQFMVLQLMRAFFLVGLGAVFVWMGMGWWGPVIAVAIGMLVAISFFVKADWSDIHLRVDRKLLASVANYGLPISVTVALAIVIGNSDRFLIKYFIGDDATGIYSAVANLTTQSISLIMMAISMAIFPLALRAWEEHGKAAAQDQMRHNASLLIALGLPAVVGMAVCAPGVSHWFLGPGYREHFEIIPLIACGTFLSSFKAFHFDTAFQFSHRTIQQVWIVLFVSIVNIIFNLIAIPIWGINGAAGASVVAYTISIALTAYLGRRHFVLPFPMRACGQALLASALMAAAIYPFRLNTGIAAVMVQVGSGIAIYGAVLLGFNFLNGRDYLVRRWNSRATTPVAGESLGL